MYVKHIVVQQQQRSSSRTHLVHHSTKRLHAIFHPLSCTRYYWLNVTYCTLGLNTPMPKPFGSSICKASERLAPSGFHGTSLTNWLFHFILLHAIESKITHFSSIHSHSVYLLSLKYIHCAIHTQIPGALRLNTKCVRVCFAVAVVTGFESPNNPPLQNNRTCLYMTKQYR